MPNSSITLLIAFPSAIPEGSIRIFSLLPFNSSKAAFNQLKSWQQIHQSVKATGEKSFNLSASILYFPISFTITLNCSHWFAKYPAKSLSKVVFPAPRNHKIKKTSFPVASEFSEILFTIVFCFSCSRKGKFALSFISDIIIIHENIKEQNLRYDFVDKPKVLASYIFLKVFHLPFYTKVASFLSPSLPDRL